MDGIIEAIFLAQRHGQPQQAVERATLTAGFGLDGDRYAGNGVVSLIEAEAVERFNAQTGLDIRPEQTGRNLLTRGVALNPLVGRRFRLGDALVEGFELCDPCATLGARLATKDVPAKAIVKAFLDSAGLRVRVLSSGSIAPGTSIEVPGIESLVGAQPPR